MRRAPELRLLRGERARLVALVRTPTSSPRLVQRAQIVLRASEGAENREIANELGTDPGTVAKWRRRFLMQRVPGVEREAPRPGRPPTIPTETIRVIVRSTLGRRPPNGRYWSARSLAREVGVSKSTIQRVWKAHHLEPRRAVETFRPNPGAAFVDKITDFVGLYLNPPERAMVFSVDERAKGSGLAPRERRTIEAYAERSRALEFRAFLQAVDRETPKGLDLHLLVDGRLASAAPEVRRWLAAHPRIYLHFVPSEREGPNVIDRWIDRFAKQRAKARSSPSAVRLHRALRDHFRPPGSGARPFVWTATSDEIRDRFGETAAGRRTGDAPRRARDVHPL